MPRSVTLVHDDPTFVASARSTLEHAGFSVTVFPDPMVALNKIESLQAFHTLITRMDFPHRKSNGLSLALVLRTKFPDLNVIFVGRERYRKHTEGVGIFIPHPVDLRKLVDAVQAGANPH